MKTYEGSRVGHTAMVTVEDRPLNPRLDLWNHSPSGFEWGYEGSGPAQLALALLCDHLEDDEEAIILHHEFKRVVVAHLPHTKWELTTEDMEKWLNIIKPPSRR